MAALNEYNLEKRCSQHDSLASHPDGNKFWRLIEIARHLSNLDHVDALCESILHEAVVLTNADGGSLFLKRGIGKTSFLKFGILQNRSLDLNRDHRMLPPIPLFRSNGDENLKNVVSYSANTKSIVNIADAYTTDQFDFEGTKIFDQDFGYRTKSVLTIPLLDHKQDVIGVVELLNALDQESGAVTVFDDESQRILEALAALVSMILENHMLAHQQQDMLIKLSSQSNVHGLFDLVLIEARKLTLAQAGTLYLVRGSGANKRLVVQQKSLFT